MEKKQREMHLLSLAGLAFMVLCFWILGGGTNADAAVASNADLINTDLPNAAQKDMASGRLDAIRMAQDKESKESRRRKMQADSFDWLDAARSGNSKIGKSSLSDESEQKPAVNVNTKLPDNDNGERQNSRGRANAEREKWRAEREAKKQERLREKRKQLEKELGIDLASYDSSYGQSGKEEKEPEEEVEEQVEEPQPERKGFYGIGGKDKRNDGHIKAVVHGLHKDVTAGSVIKMRLLEPVHTEEMEIPRNTFVYGKLSFSAGRAMVRIENINFRDRIVPFTGSLYDRDGFEGLYVPDNVVSEAKKDAAGQMVSSANVRFNSPISLLNSAANAVTGAIKTAASSAVREPKITISSNYLITIKRGK